MSFNSLSFFFISADIISTCDLGTSTEDKSFTSDPDPDAAWCSLLVVFGSIFTHLWPAAPVDMRYQQAREGIAVPVFRLAGVKNATAS